MFQDVPLTRTPPHQRPAAQRVPQGTGCHIDTQQPSAHRRLPRCDALRGTPGPLPRVCRGRPRLPPRPRLSAPPHGPRQRGGGLTHHAPDARVRRGGRTRWRLPGPTCPAVCTVRPPVVWRYRTLRPDVARAPLWAPHGGRSLHRGAPLAPPRAPGPRAPSLGPGAAEPGGRCDAGCPVSPGLSPGRCHAPPRPNGDGGSAHHQQRLGALVLGLQRVHEGQRLSRILGRVSPRSPGAGAGVPGPGGPHRWLGEYDQA